MALEKVATIPSAHRDIPSKMGFAPILDPDDPYRYLEIRGVVDIEDDPERKLIDRLSKKYYGKEPYPNHKPGDERVIMRIRPTRVNTCGA